MINFVRIGIPVTQGAFSDEVAPDIDGFTDEPVVKVMFKLTENTFIDDSK